MEQQSTGDGHVADTGCGCGRADRRAVVALPDVQAGVEMLGGSDRLGSEGRDPLDVADLGHPVREEPHRHDLDAGGKRYERTAQGSASRR